MNGKSASKIHVEDFNCAVCNLPWAKMPRHIFLGGRGFFCSVDCAKRFPEVAEGSAPMSLFPDGTLGDGKDGRLGLLVGEFPQCFGLLHDPESPGFGDRI